MILESFLGNGVKDTSLHLTFSLFIPPSFKNRKQLSCIMRGEQDPWWQQGACIESLELRHIDRCVSFFYVNLSVDR